MSTVAEHVPFNDLCSLCEKIYKRPGKEKKKPLYDFIAKWRDFHSKLHSDNATSTDSFFPALRLLCPGFERQRAAYGIKEFALAKLYIGIFCLDKNSRDAQKLLNYRSPHSGKKSSGGDFASVAYFILKNRCPEKGTLKIHDVNFHLDNISASNASKNKDDVKASLLFLLQNTTALQQMWLIRMIVKDMKLGLSENSILKAYHVDGVDLYNVTNSLEKVCIQLKDPDVRLHEIEISLFLPFRPMLGEQTQPNEVEKMMNGQPFVIEIKYDGERLQIHKRDNVYKFFSRNAHEVTHVYGAHPSEGKLTPQIAKSFKPHVRNCILDGEIVIYSNKNKCIVSKGANADVQALDPDGDYEPCFCVFDILLLNDKVLSNLPLSERVDLIRNSINPIAGKMQLTEQKIAKTNQDVATALNAAIDNREEGIIVKDAASTYRPNARKGGWLKIKPDYIDNLMDELDLLIIGGYFGDGRRANKISHFLLGVSESFGTHTKKFVSVAKVGSGYSDKELGELLEKLQPHWETYDRKKPLQNIVIGSGHKERPEVWIEPSKSCIVQVKAAEIVRSEKFATNYTLRFPRVQRIRYDKSWHECMTLQEFEEMRNKSGGRLANTYELPTASPEPSPKKARRMQPERNITVAPHFRPTIIDDIEPVSDILKDKEICVIASTLSVKQHLEKTVAEHGGKLVQNPGPETFCVLSDKVTVKVSNIISTNKYDVVQDNWLTSCVETKELLPWTPINLLHCTASTQDRLGVHFDEFGDSYTMDVTEEDLRKCFKKISRDKWTSECLAPREIAELEFRYFSRTSEYGLFRTCCVYVDDKFRIGDPTSEIRKSDLKLTAAKLKLYGAVITQDIDDNTTHVIVHSRDTDRLGEIKNVSKSRHGGRFHIVSEKWVGKSIKHKNCLQEKEFMPR